VGVAVLAVAAQGDGVGRVLQAEEVQAARAGLVAGLDTDGNAVVELLVDDDVVASADGEGFVEMTSQVLLVGEADKALGGVEVQELFGCC
jgi:hypothetical protein